MPVTEAQVLDALRAVMDPDLHRDIVTLGFVKELTIDGGDVSFNVQLTTPACPVKDQLQYECEGVVSSIDGVTGVMFISAEHLLCAARFAGIIASIRFAALGFDAADQAEAWAIEVDHSPFDGFRDDVVRQGFVPQFPVEHRFDPPATT